MPTPVSPRRVVLRTAAAVLACGTLGVLGACRRPAAPAAAPTTAGPVVYLVRHAEKAPAPPNDPPLSAAGAARAAALADRLVSAGVRAILVTPTARTAATAAPLAARLGLTPTAVPFGASVDEHARAVAAAAAAALEQHPGGAVLVVGHSNTVGAIVAALGAPRPADLCDAAYATLFVVRPATAAAPAAVTRARYGAADPPGADSCAPAATR